MDRRTFLSCSAAAIPLIYAGKSENRKSAPQSRSIVIDGMGEIRLEYPMSLISEIISSGMCAVQITIGTPTLHGNESFHNALKELSAYEGHINKNRKHLLKATSVADIDTARNSKRLALFYLFQNTTPIGKNIENLEFFYNFGVRSIQMTYNSRNLVGDGCMERTDAGLSAFGVEIVDAMNAHNMLIDLSHSGMKTMSESIAQSKKPVVISHSGCKAVYEHPRSVTDQNLRALAENGGVIGIFQINPNLGPKQRNTLDDYLDHIDHAVNTAGIDHVGIGSDREHAVIPDTEEERKRLEVEMAKVGSSKIHWPFFLSELNHPRRMETIRQGLEKRSYKTSEIEKIMGNNFYRVYKEVIG